MDEDELIIKCFTQSPNVILYGLPHLPIQDKWALITLMGLCWDRSQTGKTLEELEGPYKLSLREISNLTGIDHTILRSKQGKNPREGVLDRLERFGYVSVCEGKPIEEYTGALGREQTYLYIYLRKIWEENMSFSEAWRVPTNRLTNSKLIVFTVDHTNSHVGYVNSVVGKNNSHVDHANHTVDAASTNYVLRQENTKKIFEDNENILASNDATHISFQKDLLEKVLNFIAGKEEITYYEIERFLHPYMKVRGKRFLLLTGCENAITWNGMSDEFSDMIMQLQATKKVIFCSGTEEQYAKGRKPKLPVATKRESHEQQEWHPMIIKYVK